MHFKILRGNSFFSSLLHLVECKLLLLFCALYYLYRYIVVLGAKLFWGKKIDFKASLNLDTPSLWAFGPLAWPIIREPHSLLDLVLDPSSRLRCKVTQLFRMCIYRRRRRRRLCVAVLPILRVQCQEIDTNHF